MSSLVIEPGFFASERDVVKEELRSRVLAAALWPAVLPLSAANLLRRASLCAARHRQHRGSRRRDDRGRPRLPRHLLSARQCGAGRRRQFRPGPARPLGRPIFRADRAGRRPRSRASPRRSRNARAARTLPSTSRTRRCRPSLIAYPAPLGHATRTRRRWRCWTASCRPATVRGCTRRWSIATRSPRRRARSSTSSRAAARSPPMRSSPSGKTRRGGRSGPAPRDRPLPRHAGQRRRAGRGEERTAHRRAARARDRRRPGLGAGRGGDRRRRSRAPPTGGSPRIAAVTPADIQRVARRWLRDEASAAVRYLPEESRSGAPRRPDRRPRRRCQTAALVAAGQYRSSSPRPKASGRAARAGARDRAAGPPRPTSSASPTA